MEQIRDRVVGLGVYQHIFNDNHVLDRQIQSQIVAAYDSFIGFCITATEYYTQRGFSMFVTNYVSGTFILLLETKLTDVPKERFLRAIWGTSDTLDECALQVQKAIVKVRETGEETLNKNVAMIKCTYQVHCPTEDQLLIWDQHLRRSTT